MSERRSSVSVSQELDVDLPTAEGLRMRAIRTVDWQRCKRKVDELKCPSQKLSKLYSTFTGATLSTIIGWLVHRNLASDPYIIAMYFWASICFAFVAIGLFIMEREQTEHFIEKRNDLLTDMGEIESTFLLAE